MPYHLTFLTTIVFVILIASFVQLLELIIKKQAPTLYSMWGIYLLLIATNCIVLSVPLLSVESNYSFVKSVVFSIGSGMGFALALVLMASLREKLVYADVPKPLEGTGVAFILAGMLALAFLGFFRNDIKEMSKDYVYCYNGFSGSWRNRCGFWFYLSICK
ncbi:Na+-translocating ferredoxin:NAD+ oxidoreductase RnfA subunit [Clostridium beijerinckii]|nr:Na+-translocating ferredoxin:NAD+ oxidoreductase RnfA subunit [Clostridium beijerinckii]